MFLKAIRLYLAITVSSATLVAAASEPLALRYSPDDGMRVVTTSKITRESTIGDQGPKTDVSETKSRVVVHETAEGFANTTTVLSTTFEREGHPIASPLFAALIDLELTYRLDPSGKLIEISGYEKLVDSLKAKFPPAISQTMAPLLNYQSIKLRDEAEYRERYESLIGKTFKPGDIQASAKAHPLPYGGTMLLYVVSQFGAIERCGEHECIELKQSYNSDPKPLAAEFASIDEAALASAAKAVDARLAANHNRAKVSGTSRVLLQPLTLFLHSQKAVYDIELEISQPGKEPLHIEMNEIREFSGKREPPSNQ